MTGAVIVFVRRQSPDWGALAADHRAGRVIDPARFVPDHAIPGFPPRVDLLIARWNATFPLDFFSFRHAVARLAARSLAAAPGARRFELADLPCVTRLARERPVLVYFHDDDDFFSPDLPNVVGGVAGGADAVVTPLYRLGYDGFTFAPEDAPAAPLWGPREPFRFRYHTNNYGLTSRACCDEATLRSLKDHVEASAAADRLGLVDRWSPTPVSATVKTPGSASALVALFERERPGDDLRRFVAGVRRTPAPPGLAWIADPLEEIAQLVEGMAQALGDDAPS